MSVIGQEDDYISQLIECAIAETESSRKAEEFQTTGTIIFPSIKEEVPSSNSVIIQSSFGLDDPFTIKPSSDNKFGEATTNTDLLPNQNVFRNKNTLKTRTNSGFISESKQDSASPIDLTTQDNMEEIFEEKKAARKKFEDHYFQSFMSGDQGRHTFIITECGGINLCSLSNSAEKFKLDEENDTLATIDNVQKSETATGYDTISDENANVSNDTSHSEDEIGANVKSENDVDSLLICGQCGKFFVNSVGLDIHTEDDHREMVEEGNHLHQDENEYLKLSEDIQRKQREEMKSNSEATVYGSERTQNVNNERSASDSCSEVDVMDTEVVLDCNKNTRSQTQPKRQRRTRRKKLVTYRRKRVVAKGLSISSDKSPRKDTEARQVQHDDVQQEVGNNELDSDDNVIEPKIDLIVINNDDKNLSPVAATEDNHLCHVKVAKDDHRSPVKMTESDITKQFGIKNVCISLNRVMPRLETIGRTSPRKNARITDCHPVDSSLNADQLLLKKHGIKDVSVNISQQKVLPKKISVSDSNTDSLPHDKIIKSTNSLDSDAMNKDKHNDSLINVTKSKNTRYRKEIGMINLFSNDDSDQSNISKPSNPDSEGTKCAIKSVTQSPHKKQSKESVNESSTKLHFPDNENKSTNSDLQIMKKFGIKKVSVDVSKSPIKITKRKRDTVEPSINVLASCTKSASSETAYERKKEFGDNNSAIRSTNAEDLKKYGIKNLSVSLSRSDVSLPDNYYYNKARFKRSSHISGDQTIKHNDLDGAKDPPICLVKSQLSLEGSRKSLHNAERITNSDIAKKYGIRDVSVCLTKTPLTYLDQGKRAGILAWGSSSRSDVIVDPVGFVSDMGADIPVSERKDFTRFDDGLSTVSGRSTGSLRPCDEISIASNRSVSPQPSTSSGYIYIPRKRKRTARKSTKDEALRRQYSVKESSVLLQNLSSIEISMMRNPHSSYSKVNWLNYVVDSDSDGQQDDEISVKSLLDNFDDNFDDGFCANDIIDIGKGKAPNNKSAKLKKIRVKSSEINSTDTSVSFKDTADANLLRKFGITRSIVVLQQAQSNDRRCKEMEIQFTKNKSGQNVPSTRNSKENLKRKLCDEETVHKHKDRSDVPDTHGSSNLVLSKICQKVQMSPSETGVNIGQNISESKCTEKEKKRKSDNSETSSPDYSKIDTSGIEKISSSNDSKNSSSNDGKINASKKRKINASIDEKISTCDVMKIIALEDANMNASDEAKIIALNDLKLNDSGDGKTQASEVLKNSASHDGDIYSSDGEASVSRTLNKGDIVDDIVPFDDEVLPKSKGKVLISEPKTSCFDSAKYLGLPFDTHVKPRNVLDSSDDSVIGEFTIHPNREAQQQ